MSADSLYSIDTSSLIHGWVRAYPISVRAFAPIWDMFDRLIAEGQLRASTEVLTEIERQDDDLAEWCKDRHDMFVEIEDDLIQEKLAEILGEHPRLLDTRKGRSGAAPFVIAYALTENPFRTVVTQEGGGTLERPNIPVVCQAKGIRCIDLLQLIREQESDP